MGGLDMVEKDVENKKMEQHEKADVHTVENQEVDHIQGKVVPAFSIVAEAGYQYEGKAFVNFRKNNPITGRSDAKNQQILSSTREKVR